MVLMSVQAGQRSASFQIALKIVARPPAPRVSQQSISATSPGEPPYPMFKDQVVAEGPSGYKPIVVTTTLFTSRRTYALNPQSYRRRGNVLDFIGYTKNVSNLVTFRRNKGHGHTAKSLT
ncbi:MAG: hypothetical protein ACREWJ_04985, partial [Rhodoferax sp.]